MNINDASNKSFHLKYFRERGREVLIELQREIGQRRHKELAAAINKTSQESVRNVVNSILSSSISGQWRPEGKLRAILAATYASQVSMLELRNEVWPYEYMAFSRRIGELWEGFIRVVFDHAPNGLAYFVPPLFADVRKGLKRDILEYIVRLPLSDNQKRELLAYYDKVWALVDSGEINLELDLHFELADQKLNVDLKSGFGSNEKGNTNRLLMVAAIYKNLEARYRNVLLVRAPEDRNNHYFRILRDSGVWEAHCGGDAYERIHAFTGFDIQSWIKNHIDWRQDLAPDTLRHFRENELLSYLDW